MSMSLENHHPSGPVDDRQIDRLVDGELPGTERRELLLRLENEPNGWRQCALAFLEAQGWREAFHPLAALASGEVRPREMPPTQDGKTASWRPILRLTALAASLAVAAVLGWAFHGGPAENRPDVPITKEEPSTPTVSPEPIQPAPVEVAVQPSSSGPDDPPALLDSVVKQWEQRGYHAEMQKRLVSMELNDGRRVDVPVQEVRLRYVAGRTY